MKEKHSTLIRLYLNDETIKGEKGTEIRFESDMVITTVHYMDEHEDKYEELKASIGKYFDVKVKDKDDVFYHKRCELIGVSFIANVDDVVMYKITLKGT